MNHPNPSHPEHGLAWPTEPLDKLPEAALDLLATRATQTLTADEQAELDKHLANAGLSVDDALALEATAAHLDAAACIQAGLPDIPEDLVQRIIQQTPSRLASQVAGQQSTMPTPPLTLADSPSGGEDGAGDEAEESPIAIPIDGFLARPSVSAVGWAMAALLAIVASIGWLRTGIETVDPITAQALYQELTTGSHPSLVQANWNAIDATAHPDFAQVRGEIVFDPKTQQGVMRFVGLPTNTPADMQYQLWIVDPSRDTEPVDGGVFDATSTGETYVLVNAKLLTETPQAFVITVEHPGGVVESEPSQYRLLAAPNPAPGSDGSEGDQAGGDSADAENGGTSAGETT